MQTFEIVILIGLGWFALNVVIVALLAFARRPRADVNRLG
jgi:hypothetical protein